jgi:hypothetical protein
VRAERDDRVKVLFIMGAARSGSTILANLLGEVDGFFSAGEVRYLWEDMLRGRRCGCGRPIPECPTWTSILAEAGDGASSPSVSKAVERLQRHEVRIRRTWRFLRSASAGRRLPMPIQKYIHLMQRVYLSTAEVTGARVVVDSTKWAADAALLELMPSVDPYFLQLVRDPRAVAYSWQRHKPQFDPSREPEMPRTPALRSGLDWLKCNLAADAVRRHAGAGRSGLLRYEDFVRDPGSMLRRIVVLTGEPASGVPVAFQGEARLNVKHTVAGNPIRFSSGPIHVRLDDEWMSASSGRDHLLSTAVTLPLLAAYRYPLRGGWRRNPVAMPSPPTEGERT